VTVDGRKRNIKNAPALRADAPADAPVAIADAQVVDIETLALTKTVVAMQVSILKTIQRRDCVLWDVVLFMQQALCVQYYY
jgi:hypothetical protein